MYLFLIPWYSGLRYAGRARSPLPTLGAGEPEVARGQKGSQKVKGPGDRPSRKESGEHGYGLARTVGVVGFLGYLE